MRSSSRATDISILQLDPNRIFQLFDQNAIHGEKIVAIIASGLMAEILSLDSQNSNFIQQKFVGSTDAIGKLNILLDQNSDSKTNEIRLLQGTNFGCAYTGYFD